MKIADVHEKLDGLRGFNPEDEVVVSYGGDYVKLQDVRVVDGLVCFLFSREEQEGDTESLTAQFGDDGVIEAYEPLKYNLDGLNLSALTNDELHEVLDERNVEHKRTGTKEELIAAIRQHEATL